jgi:hypothetical protein
MGNNRLGVEWLAANDPKYVAPATKAVATRRVAFNREAMENILSGQVTRKVGGRYIQCSPIAFVGGSEECAGSMEPAYEATQEQDVLSAQFSSDHVHKAGANSKATRNQRRRLAKRGR